MFSEAISSISSRWRPSSLPMASAISGSASARDVEKKASRAADTGFGLTDIAFSRRRKSGAERVGTVGFADSIAAAGGQAMGRRAARWRNIWGFCGDEGGVASLIPPLTGADPARQRRGWGLLSIAAMAPTRLACARHPPPQAGEG